MSTAVIASRPVFPGNGFNAGKLLGYALTLSIVVGIGALAITAATAGTCVGTALTAADLTLPVLTG